MTNPLVLIIEDDLTLSQIFTTSLETIGFRTEAFVSGIEASRNLEARSDSPDLILLDLHLPHVSGSDLLSQIRADTKFNKTKIIIVTADPILGESLRGPDDHLLFKPASVVKIRNLARQLTGI